MKMIKVELTLKVEDDCDVESWIPQAIEENLYSGAGEEVLKFNVKETSYAQV